MRGARSFVVPALALALVAACQTVDLGTPPADINACRPSQAYYVQQIWPNVINKDYGGKKCTDSGCHDAIGKGRLAQIPNPQPPLDPAMPPPIPLPDDWAKNYRSATEVMNCSNVVASPLILDPTATTSHGGGMFFSVNSPEAMIIEMWVSASP
jgi:hypothetical protein